MSTFTDAQEERWRRKATALKATHQTSARRIADLETGILAGFPAALVWVPVCAGVTFFALRSGLYERVCPTPVTLFGFSWERPLAWHEFLLCRPYAALIGNLQAYMQFADVIYGVLTATFIMCLHPLGLPASPTGTDGEGAPADGSSTDGEREPAHSPRPAVNAVVSLVLCLIICYASRAKVFDFQIASIQLSKITPGTENPDSWILAFLLGFFVTQAARRISGMFRVMASTAVGAGHGSRAR